MNDELTRSRLIEAVKNLHDAILLTDAEREAAQTDLPALQRAVRNVLRPAAPAPATAPAAAPDALDDVAILAATLRQDEPVSWLLANLPPTDADALARVIGSAGEADPADHEAATREVDRLAGDAVRAYRAAVLAVATGNLPVDDKGKPTDPRPDATKRQKATDEARRLVEAARPGQARRAAPVPAIEGDRPARLLSLADERGARGALLSVGGVAVLAGEGGVAKTPLALSMAAGVAARPDGNYGPLHGGLFDGAGGPVLIASYEDWPAVTADRLRKLATEWLKAPDTDLTEDAATAALARVHVLEMSARPLFGPAARGDGDAGFYNTRPEPLAGWADLWNEVARIGARLIVVDPALSAFVGQSNDAAPVREFLTALAGEAAKYKAGVLLIAHSNKTARNPAEAAKYDPFDPGHVGGSGHWTDTARGAMSLTYDRRAGTAPGARILAVSKANYGPARRWCKVTICPAPSGEIVGFGIEGAWKPETDFKRDEAPKVDKANGARKAPADVDTSEG